MPATMKDVANRAQVSVGVVSTVLNHAKTNIRVSEKARQRVLRAAEELNYQPNLMARGLRNKRTSLIGVVAPRIDWGFWPKILQGIENVIETAGYNLIFCSTDDDSENERRSLTLLRSKGVDGIIALPARHSSNLSMYAQLSEAELPVVFVACRLEGLAVPFVYVDPYKIGFLAGEHLAGLGHRRIACIGETDDGVYVGLRDAVSAAGARVDENLVVREGRTFEDARLITKKLLAKKKRPTAIFANKDIMAVGVIKAARENGLRVPDDLSVLGTDDSEFSPIVEVPITTIGQPKREQGEAAARIILEMLEGEKPGTYVLDPYLAIRESTGPVCEDSHDDSGE